MLRECGIILNEEIEVKKFLAANFTYLDGKNNVPIKLESLKNAFSRGREESDTNKEKPVTSLIHVMDTVLNVLRLKKENASKVFEDAKTSNSKNLGR